MKLLTYSLIFALLITSLSCKKKEYPEDVVITNAPVYYSRLKVNDLPLTLQAGIDDYYMYSSYKQDSNNVYGFIGELKKSTCDNCTNSLKIQINDYKTSVFNSPVIADSSFKMGKYGFFAGAKELSYSVNFKSSVVSDEYAWNFGDGTTSTEKDPVHTFIKPGKYNVCLTTRNNNGCMSTICNVQRVESGNPFKASISVLSSNGNTVVFASSYSGGTAPFKYFWSFGDGSTSTAVNPVCNYKYRGGYPVSLMIIDSKNDTARANFNAVTQNDMSSCATNYSVANISPVQTNLALSNVAVSWKDASGVEYVSNTGQQSDDAYFEVTSISNGGLNEKGQPTVKLQIRFSCKVYNGNKVIKLTDAETVICVAYR
ncbi:MAG: PKD domain-containing protein [Bacteroidia bacterium]|nr:PKD domain-containing protein [Bacteroidia bacterium]